MLGSMQVAHADIIEFITAKQSPGRLTKFNISVNCTDDFMKKVTGEDPDDNWDLVFPDTNFEKYDSEWNGDIYEWKQKGYPIVVYQTVSAKWLWNLIMESSYKRAEPGVLFLDTANKLYPASYINKCVTTNPCGK